jgi:hypothetical protein
VCQVGIEGQEQCGAFLDEADPSVPVAVNAALVPFRLSKPTLQIEVVLGHIRLFIPNTEPWRKARHDVAHMLPDRIVALLALHLHALKLRLTLGTRTTVGGERRCDGPDVLHVVANSLLGVVDHPQPPVNIAR